MNITGDITGLSEGATSRATDSGSEDITGDITGTSRHHAGDHSRSRASLVGPRRDVRTQLHVRVPLELDGYYRLARIARTLGLTIEGVAARVLAGTDLDLLDAVSRHPVSAQANTYVTTSESYLQHTPRAGRQNSGTPESCTPTSDYDPGRRHLPTSAPPVRVSEADHG
jgi:hypothetical protein